MIRVEDVHKRFGEQEILDGVSFVIKRGSVTTIMGRSGAGKSLLLRHLTGLEKPDSGSIMIDGQDIVKMSARQLNGVRRRFGVLFQDGALFDSLTVRENVAFPVREHLRVSEREVGRIVDEKLGRVGLTGHEEKYPAQLSGGMRKRVGLARALTLDPDIVFFDEPTSGLDPVTKGHIYRLIKETHAQLAATYVLVSHDVRGALSISDDIMMLHNGKIVTQGTPRELWNNEDPAVRQFVSGSPDGPLADG